ncbi:MAG: cyclin-dependent kinase inhibitor 3 family protein [Gammaproteobacteria bacterium]|nr:MAG: cyclin-dependent kinase inhibitor 3 family protein [Gammaproteobacteria bacterium]
MPTWRIDALPVPDSGACIGLCACPGQSGALSSDLRQLHDWGARGLVTLIEGHEFELLGVTSLPEQVEALGMRWWHLPIRDVHTPDAGFETRWREIGDELRGLLSDGFSIALHCRGGLGRTGTVAARLLVELGSAPALAIEQVRRTRPGSIETREQEEFVHRCKLV